MFDFTTEQVEFLESSGKVVLHACPGSGKTTIVARKLANYLQCWNRPHQGIAVLSFTNVASDEIRHQATEMLPEGYCVDDPHFIGTLDSFIDNFIFLRFGYLLQKKPKRPVITSPDVVNTELMRIAYVAMTRPRKLLVVAMPKNKAKLSNRFPPDKWDYVEL